jgi:alkylation response protein AidB-like acyl-CoA dehydrogenase
MVAGTWSGSMCLTEPHCGTDLGLLTTKAVGADDGTFKISGAKIFITSGDHDLSENILHLVIARIAGAPAGTRGISLFMVPKFLVNDDGTVGERNGVTTASIEHKMGIKGSATCALNFENATGYLIGEENRGLAAMFKMMNIERMTVAMQGLGFSEIAYQNALAYALDRRQSKAPDPRPDDSKAADPIAYQPDVKRQLLTIRAQVEGGRALAVYGALHADIMEKSDDAAVAADAENTVALLTPVMKAFFTDLGMSSTLSAQQIFGGHGYIREHGMEQLVRDCRITPIYEGTNEIQALDLVSRKLTGSTGKFADKFMAEWLAYTEQHGDKNAAAAMQDLITATSWIRSRHATDDAAVRGAATQYLRLFALAIIGCMWTKSVVATQGKDGSFYATKRKVARFYAEQLLPETASLLQTITGGSDALAKFSVDDFSN